MYMTDVYHAKWHQYVFLNGNVNIFKSSQKSYFHNFTNLFLYIPGPLTVWGETIILLTFVLTISHANINVQLSGILPFKT